MLYVNLNNKKMKHLILIGFLLLVVGLQAGIKKSNLKILYVGGSPDINTISEKIDSLTVTQSVTRRMASFEKMLKQYFKQVMVIRAEDYRASLSDDYDVTIMDGRPREIEPEVRKTDAAGRIVEYKRPGYLPYDFDRPMLMIAEMSSLLGSRIGLKTDWYCLCLDADAHHIRMDHPVFNGPFPMKMTIKMKPTPEAARDLPYFKGGFAPDSLPMWRVQKEGYSTKPGVRVGMVSRPGGFEDSPEAEVISGGVSAKTLDAVAIGRHGNFLHWGFAASPADMTEEAKTVFANAVVYISQFAGQTPIARKYDDGIITRDGLRMLAYTATYACFESLLKAEQESQKMMEQMKQTALEKQSKGEELNSLEQMCLNYRASEPRSYEENLQERFPELYLLFGADEKGYADYFANNADYFMPKPGSYGFSIDEDARSLGISNKDPRILDQAICLMEEGTNAAKGERLLKRYTLCHFETAAEWRSWFEANKSRLFFTESGGWVFMVNTRDKNVAGNDYPVESAKSPVKPEEIAETDDQNPVRWGITEERLPNGNRQIVLRAKIHLGYHIYACVAESDPFIPTTVEFRLPDGAVKVGDLKHSSGKAYNNAGTVVYEKEAVFRQEIKGSGKITCVVGYQCCNDQICMPPAEVELKVK